MIRAVVWKEFREQWLIALTLVVLGGGLIVGAATLGDPPTPGASPGDVIKSLGVGRLVTLMLVVTSGMVCGGAMFAAEREAGTMSFLEVLPATRWALWRAKLLAGAALALVQAGALVAIAATLDLADRSFAMRLALYVLLAFAWGTLGSTLARTTLGSVGIAIPTATLAMFAFLLPICIIFAPVGSNLPRPIGWLVFEVLMLVAPLAASGWWFTAPDRARVVGHGRGVSGTRALAWLCLSQMRVLALVLSAFAFALGFVLLAPDVRAVFVWPALALAAGALAGVTAFGDEQSHRTAPFWAEGRLPLGRAWWVKIGLHLLLVGWLLFLLVVPAAVRSQIETQARFVHGRGVFAAIFRDRLFDELGQQVWKYLLVPAVYGFVAGHLCGLVFRKLVVACGVAMMVGGSLAALWWPSLLAGGLSHWQAWLPAVVLLASGRVVIRSWASDRIAGRGPLLRLMGGTGAALLAFAIGLGYRVLEVPDLPGGEDDIAFVAALPSYDENVTGREFRSASERYARVAAVVTPEPERGTDGRRRPRLDERLEAVFRLGWPATDPDLGAWLDRVFNDAQGPPGESSWHVSAALAGALPVGVFESPVQVSSSAATAASLENARRMSIALLARGLQQQTVEPEAFPRAFRTVLALSQTMRNGSGVLSLVAGFEVERLALLAADRWLERDPGPTPALRATARALEHYYGLPEFAVWVTDPLRVLVDVIERRDAPGELDPHPHYLADRYVLREQLTAPTPWLATGLAPTGGIPEQGTAGADLVAFAWTVWWERERTRRLLGLGFEQGASGPHGRQMGLLSGRPGAGLLLTRNRSVGDLIETDRHLRTHRRAMALKLAVRAYQGDKNTTPVAPADLVRDGYLGAVPADPYNETRPMNYRVVSVDGENLRGVQSPGPSRSGEEIMPFPVKPGQVLVWSIGFDREDQGGRVAPGGSRAEDIVFLVPTPLAAPK